MFSMRDIRFDERDRHFEIDIFEFNLEDHQEGFSDDGCNVQRVTRPSTSPALSYT